jgi:aryl-alcohol dehydrogenase-like predicted oxidoreductase
MKKRILGRTGLEVGELSLGAACITAGEDGFKGCLRRIVEQSLENLHRDCLDILMIHEPCRPGQIDWFEDYDGLTGPVVDLLGELKAEGLIKGTGLGGPLSTK